MPPLRKLSPDHNRILSFESGAVGSSFKVDVGMVLEAQFKPISREQGRNDAEPSFPKSTRCQPSRVLETGTNMGTSLGTSLPRGWHFASGAQLSWKAAGETASDGHPGDSRGVPWSLLHCPAGLRQGAPLPVRSPIPETPAQPSFQELAGLISLSLLATIEAPRESTSVQGTPAAAPGVTF